MSIASGQQSHLNDAARAAGLRRMRIVAVSLLGLAAVIYVVTLSHSGAWGYVNAAAEAAMVGALADWFAVTALFRHPLGIPIPHTALIPKRKNELARSLQEFVSENFLTEDVVRDRVARAQVGLTVGRWLDDPAHRAKVLAEVFRIAKALLGRLPDHRIHEFVGGVLLPRLAREPVSGVAGSLLEGIVRDRAHHGLVEIALAEIHKWLKANPQAFGSLVGERAPWWSPAWLDDRVIGWVYNQALAWIGDIRADPTHPSRKALDDLLLRLATDLQNDPDVMERAEMLKVRLLSHPQAAETVVSLWRSLRTSMVDAMDDPDSELHRRADSWLAEAAARLRTDEEFRAGLEHALADGVAFLVRTYGPDMVEVISHTIAQWDGADASRRIELHVGRDLQFIRINGTVVGALAGLGIHALSQLLT